MLGKQKNEEIEDSRKTKYERKKLTYDRFWRIWTFADFQAYIPSNKQELYSKQTQQPN